MAALKARYDLEVAKKAEIVIGSSCVEKAKALLLTGDLEVRRHIRGLFLGLTTADFAYVETMRPRAGRAIHGDVYGKKDELGLWFIKISYDGAARTLIMSCHEAEHDIQLANGRILRRPRP